MRLLRITTVPISLHLLLKGQFAYMREMGYEVVTVSADGAEVVEVLKEGVTHRVIPFTRKITPWHDLRCLISLVKMIREIRPDIIHTHTPKAGLLGMMAGKICGVPVRLHTVAGLPLMEARGIRRRMLEFTEKITYACAQKIYPNSRGLERFIINDLHTSPAKVKVIGKGSSNGIDTAFFTRTPALSDAAAAIRERYGVVKGDMVFSFVGRVVRDKGIVELVEAFKRISAEAANKVYLMIVGPFEQALDPLPADVFRFLNEDKRVILAGFQRDVRPWIMASDVFVFPSYREGFPNVVMQACLLGVPCVVSDINGCNEIIEHNETGLLVAAKDAGALMGGMKVMMGSEGLREKFGVKGRGFVEGNFRREVVWEMLGGEYERCFTAEAQRRRGRGE